MKSLELNFINKAENVASSFSKIVCMCVAAHSAQSPLRQPGAQTGIITQ